MSTFHKCDEFWQIATLETLETLETKKFIVEKVINYVFKC